MQRTAHSRQRRLKTERERHNPPAYPTTTEIDTLLPASCGFSAAMDSWPHVLMLPAKIRPSVS